MYSLAGAGALSWIAQFCVFLSIPLSGSTLWNHCTQTGLVMFHVSLVVGRNIHALDPYRMPSQAALERGAAAAQAILKAHRDANNGTYPETVAVSLRPLPPSPPLPPLWLAFMLPHCWTAFLYNYIQQQVTVLLL